jgi:hypothetical protein
MISPRWRMALPHLSEDEKVQIGGGTAQPGKVIG